MSDIGAFLSTHPLPPFIIALVISIPSLVLYVVEVIVLIKYSGQFKFAFFRLFLLRFVLDLNSAPTLLSAISSIAFCGIYGLLNIATIIAYNATSESRMTLSDARKAEARIELRITVYAIITFIAQLFFAICMTLIHVACCVLGEGWDRLFFSAFYQLPWVNDFSHIVVPSWALLWASESIRTLTKKELGIDKLPFVNRQTSSVAPPSTIGCKFYLKQQQGCQRIYPFKGTGEDR